VAFTAIPAAETGPVVDLDRPLYDWMEYTMTLIGFLEELVDDLYNHYEWSQNEDCLDLYDKYQDILINERANLTARRLNHDYGIDPVGTGYLR
jgi:hypothetical protein